MRARAHAGWRRSLYLRISPYISVYLPISPYISLYLPQAIARAKGSVWELLCFGPHNVELLSTAVRRLAPLGLRLLHAAHSHARVAGEAKGGNAGHHECSRIYVETVQVKSDKSEVQSEEEVSAFRASVLKVLMGTYNSEDATNFSVCSVDEASLEKLHEKLQQELQEVRPAPAPARAP